MRDDDEHTGNCYEMHALRSLSALSILLLFRVALDDHCRCLAQRGNTIELTIRVYSKNNTNGSCEVHSMTCPRQEVERQFEKFKAIISRTLIPVPELNKTECLVGCILF